MTSATSVTIIYISIFISISTIITSLHTISADINIPSYRCIGIRIKSSTQNQKCSGIYKLVRKTVEMKTLVEPQKKLIDYYHQENAQEKCRLIGSILARHVQTVWSDELDTRTGKYDRHTVVNILSSIDDDDIEFSNRLSKRRELFSQSKEAYNVQILKLDQELYIPDTCQVQSTTFDKISTNSTIFSEKTHKSSSFLTTSTNYSTLITNSNAVDNAQKPNFVKTKKVFEKKSTQNKKVDVKDEFTNNKTKIHIDSNLPKATTTLYKKFNKTQNMTVLPKKKVDVKPKKEDKREKNSRSDENEVVPKDDKQKKDNRSDENVVNPKDEKQGKEIKSDEKKDVSKKDERDEKSNSDDNIAYKNKNADSKVVEKRFSISICDPQYVPYNRPDIVTCTLLYSKIKPLILKVNGTTTPIEQVSDIKDPSTHKRLIRFKTPKFKNDDGHEGPITIYIEAQSPPKGSKEQFGNSTSYTLMYASLFMTKKDCYKSGTFQQQSKQECSVCKTGSNCPGGGKSCPKQGYWSRHENEPAGSCPNSQSCTGSNNCTRLYNGELRTDNCQRKSGYLGVLCQKCAKGYYKTDVTCRKCGSPSSAKFKFILLMIVAAIYFILVSIAVVTLSYIHLGIFVSFIMICQSSIQIIQQGVDYFSDTAANFVGNLDIINFKIEFVRPECFSNPFTFIDVFYISLAIMIGGALFFILASALRAFFYKYFVWAKQFLVRLCCFQRNSKDKKRKNLVNIIINEQNKLRDFKWRVICSLCLFGCLTHLQSCVRVFDAFNCRQVGDHKVLVSDPSIICFEHAHLYIFIIAIFWGLFHIIVFPIQCLQIVQQCRKIGLQNESCLAKYGFLYRAKKPRFYQFHITAFILNTVVALKATMFNSLAADMFFSSFTILIKTLLIGIYFPFENRHINLIHIIGGIATVIQIVYIIWINEKNHEIIFANDSKINKAMFILVLIVFSISMLVLFFKLVYSMLRKKNDQDLSRLRKDLQVSSTEINNYNSFSLVENRFDEDGNPIVDVGYIRTSTSQQIETSTDSDKKENNAEVGHKDGKIATTSNANINDYDAFLNVKLKNDLQEL